MNINDFFYSFPHLGIQCAKKKDVENNLKQRKEINVDPFQSMYITRVFFLGGGGGGNMLGFDSRKRDHLYNMVELNKIY